MTDKPVTNFSDLSLSADVMQGLEVVGYESPSPIQAATIPIILSGKDVVGQAQTGTGKTAAFALPILSAIDINQKDLLAPRMGQPGHHRLVVTKVSGQVNDHQVRVLLT